MNGLLAGGCGSSLHVNRHLRQGQGDSQSHRILFWERLPSPTPLGPCGAGCPSASLWKGLYEHGYVQKTVHHTHPCPASTSLPSDWLVEAEHVPPPSSEWGSGRPGPGGAHIPTTLPGQGSPANCGPSSASPLLPALVSHSQRRLSNWPGPEDDS